MIFNEYYRSNTTTFITARKQSCVKVMFSQVSVCSQGVGISGSMSFRRLGIPGPRSLSGCRYTQGRGHRYTWAIYVKYLTAPVLTSNGGHRRWNVFLCFTSSCTCRKTYSSNTSLNSMVSSQSGDTPANNPYIVEDEFHVVWDFDKEAEGETHVSHTSTVPTAPSKPGKNFMCFFFI